MRRPRRAPLMPLSWWTAPGAWRYAAPSLAELGSATRGLPPRWPAVGPAASGACGRAPGRACPVSRRSSTSASATTPPTSRRPTRRGIVVSNTPDVLTDCVADTAVALVIDVMRGCPPRIGSSAAASGPRRSYAADPRRCAALGRRHPRPRPDRPGGRAAAGAFGTPIAITRAVPKDVSYTYAPDVPSLAAGRRPRRARRGGAGTRHLVDAAVLDALGPDGLPGQRRPRLRGRRGRTGRGPGGAAASPAPGWTCSPTSRTSRRPCSGATTSCSCRTSAAPPSRRARRWRPRARQRRGLPGEG